MTNTWDMTWPEGEPLHWEKPSIIWRIRQRYILAVLYYSTNGENWKNQYRFMIEGVHECNWHVNDEGKSGIYCTEQGEITLLNFCEYCFTVCMLLCTLQKYGLTKTSVISNPYPHPNNSAQ